MLIIFQVCFFFLYKKCQSTSIPFCKLHIICILLMYLFVFKLFCYVLIVMKVCELTMNVDRLTFFSFFLWSVSLYTYETKLIYILFGLVYSVTCISILFN